MILGLTRFLLILLYISGNQALAHGFTMYKSPDSSASSGSRYSETQGTFSNLAPKRGDTEEQKRKMEEDAGYFGGYVPPSPEQTPEQLDAEYRTSFEARTTDDGLKRMKKFVVRREEVRDQIVHMDHPEIREQYVDLATQTMKDARNLLYKNAWEDGFAEAPLVISIAEGLLDFAVSVTPLVGWGRDIYEAITGSDLLSGEELSVSSRSFAVLGIVTLGAGKLATKGFLAIGKGLKAFSQIMRGNTATASLKAADKVIYSAKKIGVTTADVMQDFTRWLKKPFAGTHPERGAIGNSVDKTLEIIKGLRPEKAALDGAVLFKDVPRALRSNTWDIMENLPQALKGNQAAKDFIAKLRPHELTSNFKGWTSLDLVPNNPSASPLRFLYKKEADGSIKWMIRDTH